MPEWGEAPVGVESAQAESGGQGAPAAIEEIERERKMMAGTRFGRLMMSATKVQGSQASELNLRPASWSAAYVRWTSARCSRRQELD